MTEEAGPSDSSRTAEPAAELAKRIQEVMTNYVGLFQKSTSAQGSTKPSSRLLRYANEHVNATSTFMGKLSQAADPQEVAKIQAEFVQMQMNRFNTRTKEISEAVAVVTNLLGAFVSVLNTQRVFEDLARSSPNYVHTGGDERMHTWSQAGGGRGGPGAVNPQEQHAKGERQADDWGRGWGEKPPTRHHEGRKK